MRIGSSARKHGIRDEDIRHAIRHPRMYREVEYHGRLQLFIIGPAEDGTMLEIVAVPSQDPTRVIHADRLRAKFYDLL